MKKKVYFLMITLTSAILITACAKRFNKEDLKIQAVPPLSDQQKNELKTFGAQ
jgi:hypothetical protein